MISYVVHYQQCGYTDFTPEMPSLICVEASMNNIVINHISDDNEGQAVNLSHCPTQFCHTNIEDVANDNFSVMNNLFTGAFDHILDQIFQW